MVSNSVCRCFRYNRYYLSDRTGPSFVMVSLRSGQMASRTFAIGLALYFLSGCTSAMLTRRTIDHASTFPSVQQCQVLNNVARFTNNPTAIPYFAMTTGGTTQVTNTGSATALVLPNFLLGSTGHAIWSGRYGPTASSATQENWNITPVTDPDKLRRMRCAYQYLVHGQVPGCASHGGGTDCPDCLKELTDVICPDDCRRYPHGQMVDLQKCVECLEC